MYIDSVHLSWQTAALTVWAISISNWGITRYLFSVDRSITGQRSPFFFGTRNSLLNNPRKWLLWTDSMAPFPAGCPRPSVDLVSCSWLENEWASLSKEADDIPTSTGHPTLGFLTVCTHQAGFAIARQKHLDEPPPKLLHWRAPLDGPPLVLLLRFLKSGPPVMCALGEEVAVSWLVLLSVPKGLVIFFLANWWS